METFVIFNKYKRRPIPEELLKGDNRSDEGVIEFFIKKYTKEGDNVIDIFAGLGTTLFIAEEMNRIPYGVELEEERFTFVKKNLKHSNNIFLGDSRKLSEYDIPHCDFSFSSPIFMNKTETVNPLSGFTTDGDYDQYLREIGLVYKNLKEVMKPNSVIVIEASNLKNSGVLTTLAWDICSEVSKIFRFEGEVIVVWDIPGMEFPNGAFGYGYDHHYCLIFRNM